MVEIQIEANVGQDVKELEAKNKKYMKKLLFLTCLGKLKMCKREN
jgi:hypothetical protein